jgi:DNA-binding HxlR family transcriptional regulator
MRTYSDFLKANEGIATNILASKLKEIEESGIISKSRNPDNKRQYNYTITKKGVELIPVLLEMIKWSAKHDGNTIVPKKILQRIKNDRENFIKEIMLRALQ